uniref:Uncharacterized protein n=1 Tax=Meloidogyne incognita TaxID=6306 RepID=A0A914MEW7_MELIC
MSLRFTISFQSFQQKCSALLNISNFYKTVNNLLKNQWFSIWPLADQHLRKCRSIIWMCSQNLSHLVKIISKALNNFMWHTAAKVNA